MISNAWKTTRIAFPILGTLALLLAGCDKPAAGAPGAGAPPGGAKGGPPGGFKMPVEMATVEQRDWPVIARAVGSLTADESATLRNLTPGHVVAIPGIEGSIVTQGQPIVQIDDEKLRYELQRAGARRDEAQSQLQRRSPLFQQQLISESEMTEVKAAATASEAEFALARRLLNDATVRAPISGTLSRRHISLGDYAAAGSPLFDLVKTDWLKLEFSLPENLLSSVAVGAEVKVVTAAYPGQTFTGKVDFIDPVIDPATRSVRLRARVDNSNGLLRPNLFVNAEITVDTIRQALVIPEEAVIPSLGRTAVFAVENDAAKRVEVTVADRAPGLVALRTGLTPNGKVVTGGHQKLQDGMPVMTLPPPGAMPPGAAPTAGAPAAAKPAESAKPEAAKPAAGS